LKQSCEIYQRENEWLHYFCILAHRLIAGNDNEKYVPVSPMDEDVLKADSGWNPFPKEPLYPKFDRRFPKTKAINDSIQVWKNFHQHKNDMKTMAFAMGPGWNSTPLFELPIQQPQPFDSRFQKGAYIKTAHGGAGLLSTHLFLASDSCKTQ